jgi:AcrR family transcriptional regulator
VRDRPEGSTRAQVRKEEIIRRAEELFAEHGYAQTRMTDIAEAAGVTKGLLYWYFENKEALVAEILVDLREQLRDAQRDATDGLEDPLARVYVGTVATVDFVLRRWHLFQVNIPQTARLQEVFSASALVHASDTAETLRAGQALGQVRKDDPASTLAQGNAGIVNQFCLARATGQLSGSVRDVAHAAARFILRGLAVDPADVVRIEAAHGRAPARSGASRPG